jgi:hypothetical protein
MLADPSKSLSYQDREDRDIQEALALSLGQTPSGQENGVTGTGQQFGPAKGDYRDTKQWAMTVSKATAREVIDNPPPADRQRKPGEPTFLRASDRLGAETLASLLTIYHSIPLAREALLLPSYQQFNYGYDPQWWNGHHIEVPRLISLDEHGTQQNRDDVLIETQRLMVFLDHSNRAYGSIEALADLQSYQEKVAESEFSRFMEAWNEGAMLRSPDDPLTQVFSSHGIRHDVGRTQGKYFFALEPMVDPEIKQSFTDILDDIIWSDQQTVGRPLNDVWIDKLGEIMTFRLSDPQRKKENLGVEIPLVWYPDRYMEHMREASWNMRIRRARLLERIFRLNRSKNDILNCQPDNRQGKLDIRQVLTEVAERAPVVVKNQLPQSDPMSSGSRISSAEVGDCVKALQDLVARIDIKVEEIEVQKSALREEMKLTTLELTKPETEADARRFHRYTLRGVSTKPNVTYLLRRSAGSHQDADPANHAIEEWQWWRMSLSSKEARKPEQVNQSTAAQPMQSSGQESQADASGPYTPWPNKKAQDTSSEGRQNGNMITYDIRRVSPDDVLKAAREESDSITLVYATDVAVEFQGSTLCGPLHQFIKADNKMFENEQRGIDQSAGLETAAEEEMTRLHFSPASGMQDVSLNDDSDETMNGDADTPANESVPTPARRGPDGQPSPKRAKAEDDPPPYHDPTRSVPEMQERSGGMGILGAVRPNRIGQHAEKMMDRVRDGTSSDEKEASHIEFSGNDENRRAN